MSRRLYGNYTFSKECDLDKRFHEEMTAGLVQKVHSKFTVGYAKKDLDGLYENEHDINHDVRQKVTRILHEGDKMAEATGKLKNMFSKGQLHTLFDFIHTLIYVEDLKIIDSKKCFDNFLKMDIHLTAESMKVEKEAEKDKSYIYWTSYAQNPTSYNKIRYVVGEWIKLNKERLKTEGVVGDIRKSSDSFNFKDKKVMYYLQDAKERDGANIAVLDLYLGKYEGDHVISFKDGGSTEISNAELMEKSKNRSKGATSNKPHFDFQRSP